MQLREIRRPVIGDTIDAMWRPVSEHFKRMYDDVSARIIVAHKTIERLEAQLLAAGEQKEIEQRKFLRGNKPTKFYHSGDTGDVIYGAVAIKALGGGILYLGPEIRHQDNVRDAMTPAKADSLGLLLKHQAYIEDVIFTETMPMDIDYDLNQMRSTFKSPDWNPRMNLIDCHLKQFKLSLSHGNEPWLHVAPDPRTDGRIVISRTERYRNDQFKWRMVLEMHGSRLVFIGLPHEHQDFVARYGNVEYLPTPNLLDVARLIYGADLFIGNQSCPRAIAEGLKVPCIMEGCSYVPNCNFERKGVVNLYRDERLVHPPTRKRMIHQPLVIHGVVDGFTGFGQALSNWATGLAERGWNVSVKATRKSDQFGTLKPEYEKLLTETGDPKVVFETHDELLKYIGTDQVVITMWEAPRVNSQVVEAINRARVLVVPSTWCATGYSASGVNIPIRVVPLGIDTTVFKRTRPVGTEGLITFGCSGRYAHGPMRKGLALAEEAFKLAFPVQRDVRLNMKVFEDCEIQATDDRVILERRFLTDEELADWYRANLCHVSASRSGAWEIQGQQAAAVGCCPIAVRWSGPVDYLTVGRFVDYRLEPAMDGSMNGYGVWAEPSVESMAAHMIWVHDYPEDARDLGRLASEYAIKFSSRNSVLKLEAVLREFGIL